MVAASVGLFALLLQIGFTLGAAAGHDATSGRLAQDLAQLCSGGFAEDDDGSGDKSGSGTGCDHCRLCGAVLALLPPPVGADIPLQTAPLPDEPAAYQPPRQASGRHKLSRAPPV